MTDPSALTVAVESVRRRRIVAYPTDTTYALAVDAMSHDAVACLANAKGRDRAKPIPIVASDMAMLDRVAVMSTLARQLAERFLPGALTMVLPAKLHFPSPVRNEFNQVGVRIPNQAFALSFVAEFGNPLTATSANPAGVPAATDAADFAVFSQTFLNSVSTLVDGGSTNLRLPSTVISVDNERIELIREGAIPFDSLLQFVGRERGR